jgi:branched-chain amino acid transport system permease protein
MALLPSGVFAQNYGEDRALIRTNKQWAALGLFIAALLLGPVLLGGRFAGIANSMLIMSVAVVGLQITLGYAGQINLGQAALMGVGAFTTAFCAIQLGWPFWLSIPVGGVAAAGFGFLFGLSAARVKGFYLALTTIAAQFIFHFSVLNLPARWFGGPGGLTVPPVEIAGYRLIDDTMFYYLNLAVTAVMVIGAFGIARSRFGRAFISVRDDDIAAGMVGINVVATKALAFLVGAFYAGIAGGLWAYYIRFVGVEQFSLISSVWMVAMIIIGGMGSIVGALVGVFVIHGLEKAMNSAGPALVELLPGLGPAAVFAAVNIVLGILIAIFVIKEPKGLMYRWHVLKQLWRLWPFPY